MSDTDRKNHWQSLANEIGAEIPPEPEPPHDEVSSETASHAPPQTPRPEPRKRPQPPPRPPSHWSALASELGLQVPDEPVAAEFVPDEGPATTAENATDNMDDITDTPDRSFDQEKSEAVGGSVESQTLEPISPQRDTDASIDDSIDFGDDADETAWSAAEGNAAEEESNVAAIENEPSDARVLDSGDREDEEESVGRRRRKRRGRRRRKRLDDETEESESSDQPRREQSETIEVVAFGSAEIEEIEIVPTDDEEVQADRGSDEGSNEEKEPRGRRRRRRGRRGTRRRDEPTSDAGSEGGDDRDRDESSDELAEGSDDDFDEDDSDQVEPRSKHRKIPTWEETLAAMVDANIKNHAATENSGRRGRGRRGR